MNIYQKQQSRDVFKKRCSKNMHQIYRKIPMPKCNFNKVASGWVFAVNLLHIFRTPILKNTSGGLLLIYIDRW